MHRIALFAVVALAAFVAVGAASSVPAVHATGTCAVADAPLDTQEMAFLTQLNAYRQQHGLGALTLSPALEHAAAWMARDMTASPGFSHTDSLGRDPWTRDADCGYTTPGAGETLAAGTDKSSASSAMALFENSAEHNAILLSPEFTVAGVARATQAGSQYGWYWAVEFGVDGGSAPAAAATSLAAIAPASPSTPTLGAPSVDLSGEVILDLQPGANLVTWGGPDTSPAIGLAGVQGMSALAGVYQFDSASGTWLRFIPSLPANLQTLTQLVNGQAYWFVATRSAELHLNP